MMKVKCESWPRTLVMSHGLRTLVVFVFLARERCESERIVELCVGTFTAVVALKRPMNES